MMEWNYVDQRRLVGDALRQLGQSGKAYVCDKEQLDLVIRIYKDAYHKKIHEKCYVIYLPFKK